MSDERLPTPRSLPAGAGLAWLLQGLALVRAQPIRLLLISVLMQAVLSLSQVPLLGIFVMLAVPGLSAGILQAFARVERGQRPALRVLFEPLATRPRTGRLLALGALLFAAGVLAVSLALGSAGSGLDPLLLERIQQGDAAALAALDPALIARLAAALALAISVTGVLSFLSIPLIWFGHASVGRALRLGLHAMWINWKPLLVLGLGLGVLLLPVLLAFRLLIGAIGALPGAALPALGVLLLLLLLFQLAVFGTQYRTFAGIFGTPPDQRLPVTAGPEDDQFVA